MNNIKKLWANYQAKRVDHILNWPTSRVLGNRWAKRVLAALAVVSSWFYLLLLIPGVFPSISPAVPYQLLSGLVMLSSFMLLRQSVRRITSLPDEYLDERETDNRDWAYRLGYLVVRRIGLVLTLALFAFGLYIKFSNGTIIFIDGIESSSGSQAIYHDASDFIRRYFALTPVEDLFLVMLLLTYVAYSFPVILLAWREASGSPIEQPTVDWKDALRRYSKGYFARLLRSLWVILLSFVAVIGHFQDYLANFAVLTILYSIYVYFWAMFIQFEVVSKIQVFAASDENIADKRRILEVLAWVTVSIGITLPIGSWLTGPYSSDPYSVVAVLALFALQLVSFSITRKLAKS